MKNSHIYETVKKFEIIVDAFVILLMVNSSIYVQIILFTIAVLFMVGNLDVYNPRCWFTVAYYFYSVGYPILYLTGLLDYNYGYSNYLLPIQLLGLICFLIGTSMPYYNDIKKVRFRLTSNGKIPTNVLEMILVLGNFGLLISMILLIQGGFSGKNEIYSSGNIIITFFLSYIYLHVIFTFFLLIYSSKIDKMIILSLLMAVFHGLVSGERDVVFHIIIMMALYLYSIGKIKKKAFIILFPIMVVLIPTSAAIKYLLLSGSVGDIGFLNDTRIFMHDFFYSEFIAASRNLQRVLNDNLPNNYTWYSVLLSILSRFVNVDDYKTPMNFFNMQNYANSSIGHGFTIIGEGMYYGNIIGVIVLMFCVGLLARKLYNNSFDSVYYKTLYLYMVPLFMYACRGEISTIIVPLIKYGFVSFMVLESLCDFSNKRAR